MWDPIGFHSVIFTFFIVQYCKAAAYLAYSNSYVNVTILALLEMLRIFCRAVICCWSSLEQSLLVSGPIETHNYIPVRSNTTCYTAAISCRERVLSVISVAKRAQRTHFLNSTYITLGSPRNVSCNDHDPLLGYLIAYLIDLFTSVIATNALVSEVA
jgi:hypothetical protein